MSSRGQSAGRLWTTALAVVVTLAIGACSDSKSGDANKKAAPVPENKAHYTAALAGVKQTTPPGDPDGSGAATLDFDREKGEVCVELTVQNLEQPVAAHVQAGPANQMGAIIVPIPTPVEGSSKGCEKVAPRVLDQVLSDPGNYYVNVRTRQFPAGAVRGQLEGKAIPRLGEKPPPSLTPGEKGTTTVKSPPTTAKPKP